MRKYNIPHFPSETGGESLLLTVCVASAGAGGAAFSGGGLAHCAAQSGSAGGQR